MCKKLLAAIIVLLCLISTTVCFAFAETSRALLLPLSFIIISAVLLPCLFGWIIYFIVLAARNRKKKNNLKTTPKVIRIKDSND